MDLQKPGTKNWGSKGNPHMKYRMVTYKVTCPATHPPLRLKLKRLTVPSAGVRIPRNKLIHRWRECQMAQAL